MVIMRLSLALALLARLVAAQSLPDAIGAHPRTTPLKAARSAADQPLWDELGLKYSDSSQYANSPAPFTVSVYRLSDSTAALAAFYWQRPASSMPSKAAPLAAETRDGLLLVYGNYLLAFEGYRPPTAELEGILGTLPRVDHSALPTHYLPVADLVPNSERYVTGPAGLEGLLPRGPDRKSVV